MGWFEQCSELFQGGGMMVLSMFLFWGVLIVIGFYLMKTVISDKKDNVTSNLSILKNRLAKGEITVEQFDRLKNKI